MSLPFIEECVAILSRTPAVLDAQLRELPEAWAEATEGAGTWSPYTVVGHLIHCEKTDWMVRAAVILEHGATRAFDPVDRDAQFGESRRSLSALLDEFTALRIENLARLEAFDITAEQLDLPGMHPDLGPVNLRQLLATWATHDLAHTLQIARVMARRLEGEVGAWAQYLSVMQPRMTLAKNRSMPRATVIPVLGYMDIGAAIGWLESTFGFTLRLRIGNHRAQMNAGAGAVVLSQQSTPAAAAVLVRVEDVDDHYRHALEAGAKIAQVPATHPYGERQYTVHDPAGHHWTFSQSVADINPIAWGGVAGKL